MDLGKTIKEIRKNRKLSQKVFASQCDISQTYLSQIENSQREPKLSTLKTICLVLEIPLSVLFFLSTTEEDIKPDKRKLFSIINNSINNLISDGFGL